MSGDPNEQQLQQTRFKTSDEYDRHIDELNIYADFLDSVTRGCPSCDVGEEGDGDTQETASMPSETEDTPTQESEVETDEMQIKEDSIDHQEWFQQW